MKRKFIKSEFKEGCVDNIKLLALTEDILQYILNRDDIKLTSAEYHEFTKAFGLMLDTAYFFLNWGERSQLLEKLQNGEITPSQAERKIFTCEGIPKPSEMKHFIWRGGRYQRKYDRDYDTDKVDLSPYSDYLQGGM
jgi:hypothetical protein